MYQEREVEQFLLNHEVKPAILRPILERMSKVVDNKGFFHKAHLAYVMGRNRKLARLYEQAWNEATKKFLRSI